MKKVIVTIFAMLLMLCIPNISKAAEFYSGGRRNLGAIYKAMHTFQDEWLTVDASSYNRTYGWALDQDHVLPGIANGYGNSIVWSTGGSCCGHGSTGVGSGLRKITIIDINQSTTNKNALYLAYAILYSKQHDEHYTGGEGTPLNHKGKWTITEWLRRAENRATYGINAQMTNAKDENGNIINSNYAYETFTGQVYVGNKSYNRASTFVQEAGGRLELDEAGMESFEESGNTLKIVEKKNQNNENCTLIGPYSLRIQRRN